MSSDLLDEAARIADTILFPGATETDRSGKLAPDALDAFAAAGLYGMAAPAPLGPANGGGPYAHLDVIETLAGGCLSTAFVWMQHHSSVLALSYQAGEAARERWLGRMVSGELRATVAFSGLRRPEPPTRARRVPGGWQLDGTAPWASGWGHAQLVYVAAVDEGGTIVWALIDATEAPTLAAEPLPLAALAATNTVKLRFRAHPVAEDRVLVRQPLSDWRARDGTGPGQLANGSLPLGVTARCTQLLGPSPLDEELARCRAQMRQGDDDAVIAARAWASELASRASMAFLASRGGRGLQADDHAQRLCREAMALTVLGQTQAIRAGQLEIITRGRERVGLSGSGKR
jgi:alkylation response protein AidB-like acyl-CoA dehydrogenase